MLKILRICQISLFLISISISKSTHAENIRLQIEGLSGVLEKNVRSQLLVIQNSECKLDKHFQFRVENAIREGLKALGYYEPTIHYTSYRSSHNKSKKYILHIKTGRPIYIGGTNVVLRGEARTDHDYLKLLRKVPSVGTVLNHGDYDDFKKSLRRFALRKGYFNSKFNKSQLAVSIQKHQAFWNIDYDSGKRYRFNSVIFIGSQIHSKILQKLVPFRKGDFYELTKVIELNRRLSETGWFNSVIVTPKINNFHKNRNKNNLLLLYGVVTPRIKNTIETGIGYSNDVGPRIKISWKKPYINSYGHSLITTASIFSPEQQINFSYKIPLPKNPLEQYYFVQNSFKRTTLNNNIKADSITFLISRYWAPSNLNWKKALNLRWSLEHFIQSNIVHTNTLLCSGVMINRTYSRGGIMPYWGYSQHYSLDYSNTAFGSYVDFIILQARHVWIRTMYDQHRFVLRNNLGWIKTKNFWKIPSELRFFAGGDHSVRGYTSKSIAFEDREGRIIESYKLVTASLEYQYKVFKKWWGAVFTDSGKTVNNFNNNHLKLGYGIGIRWESPIGLIKLDLALPISSKKEQRSKLQFYIGLGPEL